MRCCSWWSGTDGALVADRHLIRARDTARLMLARIDLRRSAAMEATQPVDARTSLSQTLAAVLDGAEITDLQRLSGGASRETWRFLADGVPRIVQRQRAGDERDMMIEADVVRAAGAGGVPVPRLLAAERQPDGASFMVLEAIEGETIARKIQRDDAFVTARQELVADLGTALARIHSLDPTTLPGLTQTDQVAVLHLGARLARPSASRARTGPQLAGRPSAARLGADGGARRLPARQRDRRRPGAERGDRLGAGARR